MDIKVVLADDHKLIRQGLYAMGSEKNKMYFFWSIWVKGIIPRRINFVSLDIQFF
jgi:hypothetical protein